MESRIPRVPGGSAHGRRLGLVHGLVRRPRPGRRDTGIDFGAASFLGAYLDLQFGFEVTEGRTILLFAAILVLHGLLNTFGVRIVGLLADRLAALGALALGLPYLINVTAYAAVTSTAVIGLYIAHVIPAFLRVRKGAAFGRGPWHLGRWSGPVGVVAVAWVGVITVLFMLPQVSPVTRESFNYAPVAVLAVLGFAAAWWLASARHWFLNPDHERTRARERVRAGAPEPVDP